MSTKHEIAATTDVIAKRMLCSIEMRSELLRLLFAHALRRLQARTAAELDALLSVIVDTAFKGEL
jgi:hypothetical protein